MWHCLALLLKFHAHWRLLDKNTQDSTLYKDHNIFKLLSNTQQIFIRSNFLKDVFLNFRWSVPKPQWVWHPPHQTQPPRHQSMVPQGYPPQAPTQQALPLTDYKVCSLLTTEKPARPKPQILSAAGGQLKDPSLPVFLMPWDVCPLQEWGAWVCP